MRRFILTATALFSIIAAAAQGPRIYRTEFITYDKREDAVADKRSETANYTPFTPERIAIAGGEARFVQKITVDATMNDYNTPNDAVEDGSLDANYFQHITYMNEYNESHGTHLVSVGEIHYEPFGLYAGKTASIDALQEGAQIAVPNDATNEARALLLLEQEGLITLAENAGITATVLDIVDNPLNLEIVEIEAAQLPARLPDVDMAVINGNYAIDASLNVADALAIEDADGAAATAYVHVVAVKEGNENNEAILALVEALKSDEISSWMEETYQGAVVPMS